jgi:4-cresol dehydrogenase (hydroxylating)
MSVSSELELLPTTECSSLTPLISDLVLVLGEENVVVDHFDLEVVSRTNIPFRKIPDVVVYPTTSAQVQEVMILANQHRVPVWPVSQGKNWGYGSKSACYSGGITMVLSKMNRIHHVDDELCYAVIEPGVTYKQLNDYLKAHHPSLWADSSGSTRDASVIGNALDRGRGLTPYADHFGCLCGMEVVLPDGRTITTGGGPDGGYPTWNTYKWGTGPYLEGIFSQSNLGIVVKSGIWLMPAPEKFDFFVFEFSADESRFDDFVADLRRLLFQGVIKSRPHLANDFAMLCIVSQYPHELLEGRPCLSDEAMAWWKKQHGISDWTFGSGMYGSRREVKLHKRIVKSTLSKYGNVVFAGGCEEDNLRGRLMLVGARTVLKLKGKSDRLLEGLPDAIKLFKGIPTDYFVRQVYFKSHLDKPTVDIEPARDGCGFIWIGPVVPMTAVHLRNILTSVKPLYKQYGFDFFVELIVESPRNMIVLFGLFYDKKSEEESERAGMLYEAIRQVSHEKGYPPYRASVASTARVFDDNPALKGVVADIKAALDPSNTLAPGKYGAPPIGRRK